MHDFDLILTLTGGLVAAFIGGYVTHRSKLSPIVATSPLAFWLARSRRGSLRIGRWPNNWPKSASFY